MLDTSKISRIGIGTWGLGGFATRDSSIDIDEQVDSIAYTFDRGLNFVEANMWYSQGLSAEIVSQALRKSGKSREDIFICQAIYVTEAKSFEVSIKEVNRLLELFQTNYIDSIQISMSGLKLSGYEAMENWVKDLLASGVARYTSITNQDLPNLKRYHQSFGNKLFSHEVAFNFEVRENEKFGIIPYAAKNDIKTIVYQPLRRNRTAKRSWPILVELSQKYQKTQNQIILNWVISRGYMPITKATNISHIDENLDSLNFEIEQSDLERLNNFPMPGFNKDEIDWKYSGNGTSIDQLSNIYDDKHPV